MPPATLPADAVEVGRVLAPRGVQGQLRIRPHAGSVDVLLACPRWFLQLAPPLDARRMGSSPAPEPARQGAQAGIVALDLAQVDVQGGELRAEAALVTSREGAERLQDAAIFIARSDFPALPQGQYYWADLIGLRVVNRDGVDFGTVRDLMETGPSQVLVVAAAADAQDVATPTLIPFVPAWVDRVDLDAGLITVGWEPDY
ncbi:MAG: ribosome maturation factor RimM [Ottowia sp.]